MANKLITKVKGKEVTNEELLITLHGELIKDFTNKLRGKGKVSECTAQDHSNMVRFLKDNGVTTILDNINVEVEDEVDNILDTLRIEDSLEETEVYIPKVMLPKPKDKDKNEET